MSLLLALALLGCRPAEPPPLGMALDRDGRIYAGAARIDVTPEITETFTDVNGNDQFDGCVDDPSATREGCDEPFDDADGDGLFDAVWIAGFGTNRPADGVHDPITVSAVVLSFDGAYVALVAMDFVGIHAPRIHQARDALAADGFDPDRMIAASSHNHQGPDVFGIWGEMTNIADPVSGLNPEYQERAARAMEDAVRQAAAAMEPVELTVGRTRMRDESPYFNGPLFGGHNPTAKMHGMVNDIRDPVVVSDQLLVLQGNGGDGTVFTLTNWSGHPETWGGANRMLSADWVGVTREALTARYGGVSLHLPECLGGMQSALGGHLPAVDDLGAIVYDSGTYEDGTPIPVWVPDERWEFVHAHGWHIANAAARALSAGETVSEAPIRLAVEPMYPPMTNTLYQLLLPMDVTELRERDLVRDARCSQPDIGCVETKTFRLAIGPVGFVTAPGELLPEVAWGLPADPAFAIEAEDPSARGATYFLQHDPDCDDLAYEDCLGKASIGDCDCLAVHDWPFAIAPDPSVPPLLDLLDTEYKASISMTDHYLSYIVPENDFNTAANYLFGDVGDHYEDSVSASSKLATELQAAQLRISERW